MSIFRKLLFDTLITKTKEDKFWEWFMHFKDRIINIPNDPSFIPRVGENLQLVHPTLNCEIGKSDSGNIEFVISCDGIKEGIPYIERLANKAPKIEGVEIIKFRQPKKEILSVKINDKILSPDDIHFEYKLDDKLHLRLYVPNFKEDDNDVVQMVFILLDSLLGEYFVMTKVGGISVENLNNCVNITELPKLIEVRNLNITILN